MLPDGVVAIPLSRGEFAVIDAADYAAVAPYRWCLRVVTDRHRYAIRSARNGVSRGAKIQMHRMLLGATPGQIIGHANGNGLDNRRCNLRFANHGLNAANSRGQRNKWGYRGVVQKKAPLWSAIIKVNGKSRYLGGFSTPELAARAYDGAAKKFFGAFAVLNLPETP